MGTACNTRRMIVKDLKGKNALLTGGSKGLGPVIARALSDRGVNMALVARTEDVLKSVAGEIETRGVRSAAFAADISDEASVKSMLKRIDGEFGPIDILVNNAGMEWVYPYSEIPPETVGTMIRTNLMGPMVLTRLMLPGMIERGDCHIVTMSSLGGLKGSPYSATYAATKAGLIEWSRAIREELRDKGIGVSVICPGFVEREGMFAIYGKRAPGIVGETTPEKVADAVIRSITKNIGEIVVNSKPVRPMLFLDAIHPGIIPWVLRRSGVYSFYREQAEENMSESPS